MTTFNICSTDTITDILELVDEVQEFENQDAIDIVVMNPNAVTHIVDVPELENVFEIQVADGVIFTSSQGPAGPAGSSEDAMPYAERVDFVGEDVIYKGYAVPGTLDSAPLWRIKKLTLSPDDDVMTQWAGGNGDFVNVWANRASYSYT